MSFAWQINQDQACSYESRGAQHEGRGAQLGNIYMLRVSATAPNTVGLGAAALRKTKIYLIDERRSAQTRKSEGRGAHIKIDVHDLILIIC